MLIPRTSRGSALQSTILFVALLSAISTVASPLSSLSSPRSVLPRDARIEYEEALNGRTTVVPPIEIPGTAWSVVKNFVRLDVGHSPGLILDMKAVRTINGLRFAPTNGSVNIGQHEIYLSSDGRDWGRPVARGVWADDTTTKNTSFVATPTRFVRVTGPDTGAVSADQVTLLQGPRPSLSKIGWIVSADSSEPGPAYNSPQEAVDGATTTFWQTQYQGGYIPGYPHTFTINTGASAMVAGLTYLPRPPSTGLNGTIGSYSIEYSNDGTTWEVASNGTWPDNGSLKSVGFSAVNAQYFRLVALSEAGNRGPWASAAEINLLDGSSDVIDFQVSAETEDSADGHPAVLAFDQDLTTFWQTASQTFPQSFTIDMLAVRSINGLTYVPRQDNSNVGNIGAFRLDLSSDDGNWRTIATGTFFADDEPKVLNFGETSARYVRLTGLTESSGTRDFFSAAEITPMLATGQPASSAAIGAWGEVIDFPLVPVAAALLPNQKILVWSAYLTNQFLGSDTITTQTAVYDPTDGSVTPRTVTNTQHDMFCPGLSLDFEGRPLVTGGGNAPKLSIYDAASDSWTAGGQMKLGRGYQASATLSDGRVFTIGGSWSGGLGGKNGEVYDPAANAWTLLSGCPVQPMLTNDAEGIYRADNHAWLFGWKNSSIFQAGPSKAMNWFSAVGGGSTSAAGSRADDPDSINGNAVMFDAAAGKILTVGGATSYQQAAASSNAHIISIGNPGEQPTVTQIGSMSFARAFANAVVLPDGQVFIVGGQAYAVTFTDDQAILTPELFNPTTNQFTRLADMRVPRTYHSIALLMPDATVISGGGGLCGGCSVNHFDAQVFSPPYLFNADGSLAARPSITSVSTTTVPVGGSVTVKMSNAAASFSLVRFGSATHTVDTDQRRIALQAVDEGGSSYRLTIPSDPGVALPGYWMLFALDGSGVPSVAETIQVTRSAYS